MSIIGLLVTLMVIGVLLWVVNTYIPMDGKIKQILNVIVLIAVVLWLLSIFGLLGGSIGSGTIPRVGMMVPAFLMKTVGLSALV